MKLLQFPETSGNFHPKTQHHIAEDLNPPWKQKLVAVNVRVRQSFMSYDMSNDRLDVAGGIAMMRLSKISRTI